MSNPTPKVETSPDGSMNIAKQMTINPKSPMNASSIADIGPIERQLTVIKDEDEKESMCESLKKSIEGSQENKRENKWLKTLKTVSLESL